MKKKTLVSVDQKIEAVRKVASIGRGGVSKVAKEMNVAHSAVFRWVGEVKSGKLVSHKMATAPEVTVSVSKSGRISWSQEEIRLLGMCIAEKRMNDPIPSLTSLLDEAQQEILEPNRRRHIGTITALPSLLSAVKEELESMKKREVSEVPVVIDRPVVVVVSDVVKKATTPELVNELMVRFSGMMDLLRVSIPKEVLVSLGTPPPTRDIKVSVPHRKLRIMIVGPFLDQFRAIEQRVNDSSIELIWHDKDKRQSTMPSVDWVIVTKHSSHVKWDQSQALVGGDRVKFAVGGIADAVSKVFDIKSIHNNGGI